MQSHDLAYDLIDFIQKSPSSFHAAAEISRRLQEAGYHYLPEDSPWHLEAGGKYYTQRNGSSVLAFQIGDRLSDYHFQITASHSDSPTFKVKSIPEVSGPQGYLRLNVEGYGGMIDASWFDRPLSLAGRVLVQEADRVQSRLLYIDRDILLIPNMPIHLNREINKGYAYNHQVDLLPLFSAGALKAGAYQALLAQELDVDPEAILASDLVLVNRQPGRVWGAAQEFVSAPKLDDLQCAHLALEAFLAGDNPDTINVYACFDNEEVGSNTKQGALSTFMADGLKRIHGALGYPEEAYFQALAKSFLISCDNAHALHPNHPEKFDPTNQAVINGGVVIKESANQKYTTDAFSQAVFKSLCQAAQVPVQHFANRSDLPGGSTLGNLSNIQVSLHALDIGLAQLAMHSSYETAGALDTGYGVQALRQFYSTCIQINGSQSYRFS